MHGTTTTARVHRTARARLTMSGAVVTAIMLLSGCFSSSDDSSGGEGESDKEVPQSKNTPYWVNPEGSAAKQVAEYREQGDDKSAKLIEKIANQPTADWIGVENPEQETRSITTSAAEADRSALLVLYNLPHRDCGQYSQGGAKDADAYRAWVDKILQGLGDREATVIVEPDSIPHLLQEGCTPQQFHDERYTLLNETVNKLKSKSNAKVYLDAGNPDWVRDPGGLVEPLNRAGIEKADGFALNVSNYQTTKSNIAYGRKVSSMVGNKPFVIDTSRNGNGPAKGHSEESWCNPPGRALGEKPTTKTGEKSVDAFLWIKRPGESDGECKGGPKAGAWYPEYALDLARNADW